MGAVRPVLEAQRLLRPGDDEVAGVEPEGEARPLAFALGP